MDWVPAILVLLAFVAVCALLGAVTKAWTGSVGAGLVAGILAAIAAGLHVFDAFVRAVGEYEGPPTAYERLADEHFWPLLIGYMVAPVIVIGLGYEVWRRVGGAGRSSS
jgi:hypothetical protein